MAEFRMPSLGADMESGTLVKWFIKPGDTVSKGDIVAEVETQKGIIDVETFVAGEVQAILVGEGEHVPVGTPLAFIGNGTAAPVTAPQEIADLPKAAPAPPAGRREPVETVPPAGRRPRVTPVARRRAEELGVDLSEVTGTGPGGAVVLIDVDRAAAARIEPPAPPAIDAAATMRAAIAVSMARSKREIPHYYLGTDIDMKRALDWLAAENAARPVTERILYAALLLKAVTLACRTVPEMNGYWTDGAFKPSDAVHLGVAIALRGGGLVAPAIHNADSLTVPDLMEALRDLVGRARSGKLRGSEVTDPTITVTNLGEQGVSTVFGVIYPPQVSLVGFGKVVERPWAVDGLLGVRPVVSASLSADHRASVGHRGGVFLSRIGDLLQEPEQL